MSDTCRMLGCDNEPGSADTDTTYRSRDEAITHALREAGYDI